MLFLYAHNHYRYLRFFFFSHSPTEMQAQTYTLYTHTTTPHTKSLRAFSRNNTVETFFITITVLLKTLSADNKVRGEPLSPKSAKQYRTNYLLWAPTQKHSVLHLLTAQSHLFELKPIVEVWEMRSNAATGRASAPASEVSIGGAVQEADEDNGHVVAAEAPHLAVGRQAAHHQLFADLGEGRTTKPVYFPSSSRFSVMMTKTW